MSRVLKSAKQRKSNNTWIPKKVISYNGPEYIWKDYKLFPKQWDFKHDSSSRYYPESNGQIERTVQTIKKALKKSHLNLMTTHTYFMVPRTSPGPKNNTPPATLLFSRPIRTILPSMNTNIVLTNKKIYRKSNSCEHN